MKQLMIKYRAMLAAFIMTAGTLTGIYEAASSDKMLSLTSIISFFLGFYLSVVIYEYLDK